MIENILWMVIGMVIYAAVNEWVPDAAEAMRRRRVRECPICGKEITKNNRITITPHGERPHYFDNPRCGNKFIQWWKEQK